MRHITGLIVSGILLLSAGCSDTDVTFEPDLTAAFTRTDLIIPENQAETRLTMELSAPAPADLTVSVFVKTEINAREGREYLIEPKEVRFLKGEKEAGLTFICVDDKIVNEERSVELAILPRGRIKPSEEKGVCRIGIQDDESNARISFFRTACELDYSESQVFIPFHIEGEPVGDIIATVGLKPAGTGNPAQEGVHFTIPEREVTWKKGGNPEDFGITIGLPEVETAGEWHVVLEITRTYNARLEMEKSTCLLTFRKSEP